MTILPFSIRYVQKTISKMKIINFIWMEKHLDIHQEGVKATWTNVQGSWYEIHLPYITDTVSAIQLEKKHGQYGDRTRDIRVISTTL